MTSTVPAPWRRRVLEVRELRIKADGLKAGNTWMRELSAKLRTVGPLGLDACDSEVRQMARDMAAQMYDCAAEAARSGALLTMEAVRQVAEERVRARGLTPPPAGTSDDGAVARMFDESWWVRRLRAAHGRAIEGEAIGLGFVHRRAARYVSDENLKRRQEQRRRNALLLDSIEAENQHGQVFTLAELADKGQANPDNRRSELMTRIAGFEDVAKQAGHVAEFWTLTCPSRFHAVLSADGAPNPKHDGSTPREAQAHLGKCFSRFRAAAHRRGLRFYGFRVAEPHHDGCPHWHALLFMDAASVKPLRDLVRRYFLDDHSPEEAGAAANRVKFVAIDPRKGTAAGYIAKYVAKNISGKGEDGGEVFDGAEKGATRVDAWAATWGIRQFQPLGGAPVGVWRELRRLGADDGLSSAAEQVRVAADAGNWAAYTQRMGGPFVERRELPLRVAYTREGEKFDPVAMESLPAENCYGEPAAASVYGVMDVERDRAHLSRKMKWETRRRVGKPEAAKPARLLPPWTRVNNCTGVGGGREAGTAGRADARGARSDGPRAVPGAAVFGAAPGCTGVDASLHRNPGRGVRPL